MRVSKVLEGGRVVVVVGIVSVGEGANFSFIGAGSSDALKWKEKPLTGFVDVENIPPLLSVAISPPKTRELESMATPR